MVIYIGSDHRGFNLKESIKQYLKDNGYSVSDLGNANLVPDDDYPDFISLVAEKVSANPDGSKGIVICGSGVGADIVANKFPRVRSALVMTPDQAYLSRNDDDTNVLALASEFLDDNTAKTILATWFQTPFSKDVRHMRRIAKIRDIEEKVKSL
ncbi:MAG: RpiB/LacA/LacB family sugar-phosphate isomerase [Parcubacteria group bacterium]